MLFVLETWARGQRPRDPEIQKGSERGRKTRKEKGGRSVSVLEEDRKDRETEDQQIQRQREEETQ